MTDKPTIKWPLGPSAKSHEHVKILGGLAATIRANAEAVRNQPDFSSSIVSLAGGGNLNTHLQAARGYAKSWIDTYQPAVLNMLQELVAYDNTFKAYIGVLEQLADGGLKGSNLDTFEKGLSLLKTQVANATTAAKNTKNDITGYYSDLAEDVRNFKSDVSNVQATLGSWQASKGTFLFSADASYASDLDKTQVPKGLLTDFQNHGNTLSGSLVVDIYKQGQEWAINEVTYDDKNAGNYQGYTSQEVYVVDVESNQLKVYTGTEGELAQQQALYESDLSAMNRDAYLIAGGALAVVVGIVVICVGAIGDIVSAGTASNAVIAIGVVLVGGGAATLTYAAIDYANKSKNASETLQKMASEEQALSVMPGVLKQVNQLTTGIKQAESAVSSLISGWEEIDNELSQFMDKVKAIKASDGPFVVADLKAANNEWTSLANLVNTILYNFAHIKVVKLNKGEKLSDIQKDSHKFVSQHELEAYKASAPVPATA